MIIGVLAKGRRKGQSERCKEGDRLGQGQKPRGAGDSGSRNILPRASRRNVVLLTPWF